MHHQKGFANLVLIGVVLVLVVIGGYFLWSQRAEAPVPVAEQPVQTLPISTTLKTYTDSVNGFSFQYPKDWQISEKTQKNGTKYVALSSGDESDIPGVPGEEIDFSSVSSNYFNPAIPTKVGLIGYDLALKALVDTEESPVKCLPVSTILRAPNALKAFWYSGSLMSSPAHEEYAILTQNGNIILITELTENNIYQDVVSKIATSFSLLNNTVFVPACAGK